MFARIFWSLNGTLAGILIGKSLFWIQDDAGNTLAKVLLGYGISHAIVSFICYKKFGKKDFLSKK